MMDQWIRVTWDDKHVTWDIIMQRGQNTRSDLNLILHMQILPHCMPQKRKSMPKRRQEAWLCIEDLFKVWFGHVAILDNPAGALALKIPGTWKDIIVMQQ